MSHLRAQLHHFADRLVAKDRRESDIRREDPLPDHPVSRATDTDYPHADPGVIRAQCLFGYVLKSSAPRAAHYVGPH